MSLNVFTDFHHSSLLNSLIMLFEGRLGGNLYRPIGEEWYTNGFWKIYDHPATVNQYLGIGGSTPDGSPKLNELAEIELTSDIPGREKGDISVSNPNMGFYFCKDIEGDKFNKAITFDGFLQLDIDIVIASIPQHIEPFKKLCEIHPNHPKLIYQIGNAWNKPDGIGVKNVMASAVIPNAPKDINFVSYHQEFDLSTFSPDLSTNGDNSKNISSFVNCFNTQDHLRPDWELFERLEQIMPEWNFKSYGGQCRDGNCNGSKELAQRMRESRFIWHTKAGGDGYGHVIHNAAAVGKPLIVKKSYYRGKMAESLLIDKVTCLDIDGLSLESIRAKIHEYNQPNIYNEMSRNVVVNFNNNVNFDEEFEKIKLFLQSLR